MCSGNTTSDANAYLSSVWGSSDSDVFAVGAAGRIHHQTIPPLLSGHFSESATGYFFGLL